MLPGRFDIAHSIVSRRRSLKLLECLVEAARGGRVRFTTPAEDRYIVLSARRNWAHHGFLAAQVAISSFLLPQESEDYTYQTCCYCPIDQSTVLPVCNGITPTDLRESGTAYRQKIPGKGPISDMQYHGGAGIMMWPHAPTCGCEWDYDGPTIH
ncbi:hypothetical protein TNCV_1056411 [Trichonephila clavipes]|nr:hypothetical protein TNCV_1056411 [Trichonephila clavipes]